MQANAVLCVVCLMLKRSGIQFPAVDVAFHATECSVFPFDMGSITAALCFFFPQEEHVSTTILCVTAELSPLPHRHGHVSVSSGFERQISHSVLIPT